MLDNTGCGNGRPVHARITRSRDQEYESSDSSAGETHNCCAGRTLLGLDESPHACSTSSALPCAAAGACPSSPVHTVADDGGRTGSPGAAAGDGVKTGQEVQAHADEVRAAARRAQSDVVCATHVRASPILNASTHGGGAELAATAPPPLQDGIAFPGAAARPDAPPENGFPRDVVVNSEAGPVGGVHRCGRNARAIRSCEFDDQNRVRQGGGFGNASDRPARVCLLEVEGPGLGIPATGTNGRDPDFHLRISDGKYVGSVYRIPPISQSPGIGRSRTNDICLLADDQVSRFQAHLTATPDGHVLLRDGGRESNGRSSNGTFVNSNCARIEAAGHRLFYGDVISVGATEMLVEQGAVVETVCTSPPLQVPGTNNGWIRWETDNPWKRQMERGLASTEFKSTLSLGRKLALLMGSHKRLGQSSVLSQLADDHLIYLILSYCNVSIARVPAPPLPAADKLARSEIPIDIRKPLFGGGRLTAEQFINGSSAPFPGACGGVGPRACVAFKVTRVTRINNSSLWRPYHWRKQTIVGRLPEILGREIEPGDDSPDGHPPQDSPSGHQGLHGSKLEQEVGVSGRRRALAARDRSGDFGVDMPQSGELAPIRSDPSASLDWGDEALGADASHVTGGRSEDDGGCECHRAGTDAAGAGRRAAGQQLLRGGAGGAAAACCGSALVPGLPGSAGGTDVAPRAGREGRQCAAHRLRRERDCLPSSQHLERRPLSTGPALDPAANEYRVFLGQSPAALNSAKDAGVSREVIGNFQDHFGGGVVVSPSAFRANMSVPCAVCNGGHLGAARPCHCATGAGRWAGLGEQCMLVLRVVLGDCHVVQDYDEVAYKGLAPTHRPRRRPPVSPETGFVHDSILSESFENGGTRHHFTEIAIYDRFQCYPEFMIYYRRITDDDIMPIAPRACTLERCRYVLPS